MRDGIFKLLQKLELSRYDALLINKRNAIYRTDRKKEPLIRKQLTIEEEN